MANGRDTRLIKRIRNEILVALKVVYPAALQAKQLVRSLIVLFPTIEFDHLKRDLHYLVEKGYISRVIADVENDNGLTPWRNRWFRLTTSGMELADRCIKDPALEE
ncbi:MAG: hypothetical protein JSU63_18975 [Phycisphaerales bacterium]|nr:MAG: hypothetical protein JSU63_18975 [Phycisphaerales bacterium]